MKWNREQKLEYLLKKIYNKVQRVADYDYMKVHELKSLLRAELIDIVEHAEILEIELPWTR